MAALIAFARNDEKQQRHFEKASADVAICFPNSKARQFEWRYLSGNENSNVSRTKRGGNLKALLDTSRLSLGHSK